MGLFSLFSLSLSGFEFVCHGVCVMLLSYIEFVCTLFDVVREQ